MMLLLELKVAREIVWSNLLLSVDLEYFQGLLFFNYSS